jgi:hypothetical protein
MKLLAVLGNAVCFSTGLDLHKKRHRLLDRVVNRLCGQVWGNFKKKNADQVLMALWFLFLFLIFALVLDQLLLPSSSLTSWSSEF